MDPLAAVPSEEGSSFIRETRAALNEAREYWHRVPFMHRISVFCTVVFSIEILCFSILLANESAILQTNSQRAVYARAIQLLGDVVGSTSMEGDAAATYMANTNALTLTALKSAQAATDAAQDAFLAHISSNWPTSSIEGRARLAEGTVVTEAGIRSIAVPRQQLVPQAFQLSMHAVRQAYADVQQDAVTQMANVGR